MTKEELRILYGGDFRWGTKNIRPCKGLRRLGISRGVQGTDIAGGVRGPRKSKPLNKSCEYTLSKKAGTTIFMHIFKDVNGFDRPSLTQWCDGQHVKTNILN